MPRTSKKNRQPSQYNFSEPHEILMDAPIGIFTSTPDGRFLAANLTMASMFGFESPEQLMASITDIGRQLYADPADRDEFKRLVEEHGEIKDQEFWMVRRDGTLIWVSRSSRGVRDQYGKIIQYQGFITDLSARKLVDQELQEKTQHLNSITENMFDMVSVTDLKGNYKYLGPSHAILGHDLDVLLGTNVMELIHPDDYHTVAAAFENFLANRKDGRKIEYRYRRADGGYLWFETMGKFIYDEKGNPKEILFSTRDFTARKQAEEALEKRLVALTQPLDSSEGLSFEEMFNIAELQRLQDGFARATNVAALITHPNGTAITEPTNFCRLCQIIRETEMGRANCIKSDSVLGRRNPGGPVVQLCLSGGLWDAGAAIYVGERHIANWLIGQVRDEEQDEEKIRAYARAIGVDEDVAADAFQEVPAMSRQQFEQVADALFTLATQLSNTAYQNVQQARFITERKRAEEKLLVYKFALEQSLDGIAFADIDGYIQFVNKAWAAMHGYSQDELAGQHLSILHTRDQMEREVAPHFEKLIVNGSGQGEFGHARKDGSTFPAHMTATVIRGSDDKPLGVVATARDITEEVKSREQARFNNYFRSLIARASARFVQVHDDKTFNEAVDYVLASLGKLFDVDRSYLLRFSEDLSTMTNTHEWCAPGVNTQIHRMQGFPTSNMPWSMNWLVKLEALHIPEVAALPEEAAAEREEFQHQNIQSLLCLPIYDDQKKLTGFMGFDAVSTSHYWPTDQIIMLQMLAEILGSAIFRLEAMHSLVLSEKKLHKSNAQKDVLFAIIAHDLTSPVAGIHSTSRILAQEAESLSMDEIRYISNEMHNSSKNVLELLNDLMQWARMSQGGMNFSLEKCILHEIINDSLSTAGDMAGKKNIAIKCDIPLDISVLADQPMFSTIIRNLVFNAVKFTKPDGNISVTARKIDSDVAVCVQDDGIGMSESILSSLFTVDKKKRQLGTEGEKGTGLGLILCKEFVEKHGGQIWVESEPGKGTKVCFTLPSG